jgi:hypothetical protein
MTSDTIAIARAISGTPSRLARSTTIARQLRGDGVRPKGLVGWAD